MRTSSSDNNVTIATGYILFIYSGMLGASSTAGSTVLSIYRAIITQNATVCIDLSNIILVEIMLPVASSLAMN